MYIRAVHSFSYRFFKFITEKVQKSDWHVNHAKSHLTQHTPVKTMATEPTMRNTPKNTKGEKTKRSMS